MEALPMSQELRKSELETIIREITLPLMKDAASKEVADVVEAHLRKAMEPIQEKQTSWMASMLAGTQKDKAPDVPVRQKGNAFGRIVCAYAAARRQGTGDKGVLDVLAQWGDKDLADAQEGVRTKALAAGTAADGGYTVAPQFSDDVQELRRARTVVRGSGPRIYPMPTGTLHLPKVATGVTGSYSGENANATHSNPTFGENILTWKKLTVTSAVSNDLLRYGSPAADAIVRDDIVRSLGVTEDGVLLRSQGVGGEPKGLRYWASAGNLIAADSASLTNASTNMGELLLALQNANVPDGNWGWIMAPRTRHYLATVQNTNGFYAFRDEILRNTFFGYPLKFSTGVPVNLTVGANSDCSEVYLVNWDDMALGDSMRLAIDVSAEAAYYNGSSVVSTFSLDQTVIRAIAEHDFVARDPNAIAILTGVRWGV